MNRREFIKVVVAEAAAGTAVMAVPGIALSMAEMDDASEVVAKRPNIVLIMADDMGYSDLGCYGGEVQTPHLDRLAANGLRFTQFYNTARCCPTRASLLTGLYAHQTGVGHMVDDKGYPAYQGYLNNQCVTIAQVLRQAGYGTYMAGKWHACPIDRKTCASTGSIWPRKRGFDRFYGTISGAGSYFSPSCLVSDDKIIEPDSPDYYYTDAVSDNAAKYITEHVGTEPDKPFFLYVAYTAPHWPLHAPKHAIAKYKGLYDKGWDAVRAERHKKMLQMGIVEPKWRLTPRDRRIRLWKDAKNKEWQARRMEVYAAQIDVMDAGIGRIVDTLQKTGRLDNTLIFFLSDNGGCAEELHGGDWLEDHGVAGRISPDGKPMRVGNHPSIMPGPADTFASYGVPWANASNTPFKRYKKWVHEGGIATPLIMHWPAAIKAKNQLRHQPGHVIDIMSSCLNVAGLEYPTEFQGQEIIPTEGKTLVPAFHNKPIQRHALYWEHMGNRAVRVGKWKLVASNRRPWELYDLEADRTELNNLADKYPEKVEQLKAMYESWAERCGVLPYPVRKPIHQV